MRTPLLLAIPAVLALAACTHTANQPTAVTTSSSTTATVSAAPATPTAQAPGPTTISQMPAWDVPTRTAAIQAGSDVFRLFARPKTPAKVWFDELAPLMTVSGVDWVRDIDPTRIPVAGASGPARIVVDETNRYTCHVIVPTKVGDYDITLMRNLRSPQWRAEAIMPPAGQK